jgi:hypothetical protein
MATGAVGQRGDTGDDVSRRMTLERPPTAGSRCHTVPAPGTPCARPLGYRSGADRRHELIILAHSMAAIPPGQLALRREEAIRLLEELAELQGRHEALRDALRRLVEED